MNPLRALASALLRGSAPGLPPGLAESIAVTAKVWRTGFDDAETAFLSAVRALDVPVDAAPAAWRIFRAARSSALGLDGYGALLRRRLADDPHARSALLAAILRAGPVSAHGDGAGPALRRLANALGTEAPLRDNDNPWRVLRVSPGAGPDAVRAAWRREIRLTHPDVALAPGASAAAIARATARAARINAAYAMLVGRSAAAAA